MTLEFMSCFAGKLPFKFLRIPVAATQEDVVRTWESIVTANAMKKKLLCWRGDFQSIDERITLINSVLNSLICIFFLLQSTKESFEISCSNQEKVLWGDCEDSKKKLVSFVGIKFVCPRKWED